MKVTLVNHSDVRGGASMASLRLLDALKSCGVDARMIVKHAEGQQREDISVAGGGLRDRMCFVGERASIFVSNGFNRADLFKVSTAECGLDISGHQWIADADVVLLNWFNQGMMSLAEIKKIAALGKPVVWTMHDMWAMTGICHHASGCERFTAECGSCPYLGGQARIHDLSYRIFCKKRRLYASAPHAFVAVSRWLGSQAKCSALLKDKRVDVIHNAFPVEDYPADPVMTRVQLGLPDDGSHLAVMCAARLDDAIKNLPNAIKALNIFAGRSADSRVTAVFCGDIRNRALLDDLKLPYVYLGNITDSKELANIYAHCSVVMSTSTFETLGYTLIEGMSAGAVPVAYGGDGRDDVISHKVNGYLAASGDAGDFANGLAWALECGLTRESLHQSVAERFSAHAIANQYISLFNNLLTTVSR